MIVEFTTLDLSHSGYLYRLNGGLEGVISTMVPEESMAVRNVHEGGQPLDKQAVRAFGSRRPLESGTTPTQGSTFGDPLSSVIWHLQALGRSVVEIVVGCF